MKYCDVNMHIDRKNVRNEVCTYLLTKEAFQQETLNIIIISSLFNIIDTFSIRFSRLFCKNVSKSLILSVLKVRQLK